VGRILQTDGYSAYDDIGGPKLVHVGCWVHARRKFVDAVKVNPQDGAAIAMVTRMDALFLIDYDARHCDSRTDDRQAQRREYTDDWLNEIRGACVELSREALPKARWGKRWRTP
jgi:transposase